VSFVTASHITNWANTNRRDCQGVLPDLVRRLIRATAGQIMAISFPVGDAVSDEGWDGVLDCAAAHPMVPDGISGWEIGTDKSAPSKAEGDYAKREADALGLSPATTTFVFVTPRAWPKRAIWSTSKRAGGHWRDVRVIAAGDLELWLRDAPVVELWLARHLGLAPTTGLTDLEGWWREWSHATAPNMTAGMLGPVSV